MSKAFPRSRPPISPPPTNSAIASSCFGVAVKTPKGIEQRVHPTMVRKDSAIAQVMGVTNAVTDRRRRLSTRSRWSVPAPAARRRPRRCLSDIADIARGVRTAPFGRPTARLTSVRKAPMQRHEGGYYIRLVARDKPGTAATIAKRLAEQEISLESIVQRHDPGAAGRRQPKPVPSPLSSSLMRPPRMRCARLLRRWGAIG